MDKVRTLSDTKREFYTHHTRPINSVYRRVVEELMVEMHLLTVNVDFRYDPIYALGVVTSYERFMQGYRPEKDKEPIFQALCQSVGHSAGQYQQDAERLKGVAQGLSSEDIIAALSSQGPSNELSELGKAIADNPSFKYSRLFAIGLYTLFEQVNADLVKDEKWRKAVLKNLSETLHLPLEKIEKDLEQYRGNLEKMAQVRIALEDALQADRKKRMQRELEKSQKGTNEDQQTDSPQDSASSGTP
ncbi:MAG: photosystem II biogenesis protein Psp29 [Cyanobacteriota bacterium]